MVRLEEVKLYLRLDDEFENDLINSLIDYSKEEIKNSTGFILNEGEENKIYKMAQLIIITDTYENRGSEDLKISPNNRLSALYLKLRMMADEGT